MTTNETTSYHDLNTLRLARGPQLSRDFIRPTLYNPLHDTTTKQQQRAAQPRDELHGRNRLYYTDASLEDINT